MVVAITGMTTARALTSALVHVEKSIKVKQFPNDPPSIETAIHAMPSYYIQDIYAVVQDNSNLPHDSLQDLSSTANADINAGFHGKYVYLVPRRTDNWHEGGVFVRIDVSDSPIPGQTDLAAGAGGKFRYLRVLHDDNNNQKISKAALYRKPKAQGSVTLDEAAKLGFNRVSADINQGRGGDYLHVIYHVVG